MKINKPLLCALGAAVLSISSLSAETPYQGHVVTKTEHFDFIYEKKDERRAAEIVAFAEDVYATVSDYFDSSAGRITVILKGRDDSVTGYFSPMPLHIALYLNGPLGSSNGHIGTQWLRLAFTHELVHCVHIMHEQSLAAKLSKVLGSGIAILNMASMPMWAIEGITTNLETAWTSGGRGRSSFFEMLYKAPLLEQEYFRLSEADSSGPFIVPGGRFYVAGYVFVAYLRSRFGSDIFARLETERHRNFLSFENAVKAVTGQTVDSLYDDMRMALARHYRDDLAIEDGERVSPRETANHYYPPFAKSEKGMLMFRRQPDRLNAVVEYDPVEKTETVLFEANPSDPFHLDATPDGTTIVYAAMEFSDGGNAGYLLRSDLYRWSESGGIQRLTRSGGLQHPAISADGTCIAAIAANGPSSTLVEVLGDGSRRAIFSHEGESLSDPRFSPDGKRLVFLAETASGSEFRIVGIDGDSLQSWHVPAQPKAALFNADPGAATIDRAALFFPRFDTDGSVIFSCDAGGSIGAYRWIPGSPDATLIVRDPVGAYSAFPSPDGIFYGSVSYRGYIVKKATQRSPQSTIHIQQSTAAVDGPAQSITRLESKPFLNLPTLGLLIPIPDVVFSPTDAIPGVGIMGNFMSLPLLENGADTFLGFHAIYYPGISQLDGSAAIQSRIGALRFQAMATRILAFTDAGGFLTWNGGYTTLALPLIDSILYPQSIRLDMAAGYSMGIMERSLELFALGDSEGVTAGRLKQAVYGGVFLDLQKTGPATLPFAQTRFSAEAVIVAMTRPDSASPAWSLRSRLLCRLPAHGLYLQAEAETNIGLTNPSLLSSAPLGFAVSSASDEASACASLSLFPPPPVTSLELRIESVAGKNSGTWSLDPYLYTAFGYYAENSLGTRRVGMAFRFDPAKSDQFQMENFALYLKISMPFELYLF